MTHAGPVDQCERWLGDYARQFANVGGWAQKHPPHSISFAVVRALFDAGFTIDDLETILQGMFAEKLKPRSYPWLLVVLKARIEDLAHERTKSAGSEPATA